MLDEILSEGPLTGVPLVTIDQIFHDLYHVVNKQRIY